MLDDAKAGVAINVPGNSNSPNAAGSSPLPSLFPAGGAPPLSPRSTSGSPRIMKRAGIGPSVLGSPLKVVSQPVKEVIPQVVITVCQYYILSIASLMFGLFHIFHSS